MKLTPAASIAGKGLPVAALHWRPGESRCGEHAAYLQRSFPSLIIPNPNGFVDARTEDLSVTDFPGASRI